MKLKIGVDISGLDPKFKEHFGRGVGRYAAMLKKHFDLNSNQALELGYFNHRELISDNILAQAIDYLPIGRQTIKQQIFYPFKLSRGVTKKFDYVHFLAQTDAPSWSAKPYILTVHDIIPLVLQDLYKADHPNWRFKFARFLENKAIQNASAIITISENTKQDLIRVLKVAPEKIFVTPLAVDFDFFSRAISFDQETIKKQFAFSRDFFLYVGGADPRKNILELITIFKKLLDALPANTKKPVLVIAGNIARNREYPKIKALIEKLKLEQDVSLTGYVSDEDLIKLYRSSLGFVFLSLYEGFGLTPIEAMAAGAPVICANNSALPEVVGEAAILVNPHDHLSVVAALQSLMSDSNLRKELIEKGKLQAQKFTWENTAKLTLEVYQSL